MSRFANKIPGIKQSQRAYVTFLNKLRFDVAKDILNANKWKGATDNDIDELALFINRATGRGSLGKIGPVYFNAFAPVLNATFFAPRLLASRPQALLSMGSSSALVRGQAATDLVKFVGTGLSVLSLASFIPGVTIKMNPLSSDFGKIKAGNTTLEFWGGYQSIARYTAQLIMGKRVPLSGIAIADGMSSCQLRCDGPASRSSTRFSGSSLNRPASAAPAEPAPTTM